MTEKKQGIAKAAALVTGMMLCFKLLGFIKQAVIAYYFGADKITDAYFISWGFVNGITEAVINALSVSLVAIYTTLRVKKGVEQASRLINGLLEILIPAFVFVSLLVIISAPFFSWVLAPSFQDNDKKLVVVFIRILAPIIVFACLEFVFRAVLDSYKSFFVPRLQSLVYSVCVILSCVCLSKVFGVKALIIAQYASSVLFSAILILSVRKYHSFCLVKLREIPEIKNIFVTAIPLFIGNSAIQINQIVDKSIASGLGEGATSSLSYCHSIEQFVTNIMIVNIGNVMFANFAELTAKKRIEEIRTVLSNTIEVLIAALTAISVITIVCAEDIVRVVYYRGSFSYSSVVLTATVLMGYAVSFVAVAVRDMSIKSMYSFKDTKHPMYASLVSICINIVFSIVLSKYIGIMGISFATSISAVVGMMMNAHFIKQHLSDYSFVNHWVSFVKCIPGVIILGGVCYSLKWLLVNTSSIVILFVVAIVGLPLYYLVLLLFKEKGALLVYSTIKEKYVNRYKQIIEKKEEDK